MCIPGWPGAGVFVMLTPANRSFCTILEIIYDRLNNALETPYPSIQRFFVNQRVSGDYADTKVINPLQATYYGTYSALLLATENGEVQGQSSRWLSAQFTGSHSVQGLRQSEALLIRIILSLFQQVQALCSVRSHPTRVQRQLV